MTRDTIRSAAQAPSAPFAPAATSATSIASVLFATTADRRVSLALAALRAVVGLVFVMHGWQKFFVLGHAGVTGFFESVGIPFASINAVIVPTIELFGGLALLAGLGTRIAGALVGSTMVVAIATVHLANGFFLPNGYEFALTMLVANLALVVAGAGAFSLDARLAPPAPASAADTVERRKAA